MWRLVMIAHYWWWGLFLQPIQGQQLLLEQEQPQTPSTCSHVTPHNENYEHNDIHDKSNRRSAAPDLSEELSLWQHGHHPDFSARFWELWQEGFQMREAFSYARHLINTDHEAQEGDLGALHVLSEPFGGCAQQEHPEATSPVMKEIGHEVWVMCVAMARVADSAQQGPNATEETNHSSEPSEDARPSAYRQRQPGDGHTAQTEEHDVTQLMESSWHTDRRKMSPTRLWKELPASQKSESVRRLGPRQPPWKKHNNPPLADRGLKRAEPPRAPPPTTRKPARAKARPASCRDRHIPEPTTPDEEEVEVVADEGAEEAEGDTQMTQTDALTVWHSLFEMNQDENVDVYHAPALPTHIMDNIVETLVDRPESEHDMLVDTLPLFLGRLQTDFARALSRARKLRGQLSGSASSTDVPRGDRNHDPGFEEQDDTVHMQTTIDKSLKAVASPEDLLLGRLHRAFMQLRVATASSRALRLASLLAEHDGPLAVDRSLLESLLVAINEETPAKEQGDHLILEHQWVNMWWRRLQGKPEITDEDVEAELQMIEDRLTDQEQLNREAEEAHQDAQEELYYRHLAEVVEEHQEQRKSTELQAEEDAIMKAAMDFTKTKPKTRMCLGICIEAGRKVRAWEWELDSGTQVQVHIKAEPRTTPGVWMKHGKPVPESEVPRVLLEPKSTSASSSSTPATHACAVVQVGGPGLLAYFHEQYDKQEASERRQAMDDIPQEIFEDLENRDTLSLECPGGAPNDDHAATTQPLPDDTENGTDRPAVSQQPAPTETENPDPYYNGRLWYEKYGGERCDVTDSDETDQVSNCQHFVRECLEELSHRWPTGSTLGDTSTRVARQRMGEFWDVFKRGADWREDADAPAPDVADALRAQGFLQREAPVQVDMPAESGPHLQGPKKKKAEEVLMDAKVPEVEPQTSRDAGRSGAAVGPAPEPEVRPSQSPTPPAEPREPTPQSRRASPEPKAVSQPGPTPSKSVESKEGPLAKSLGPIAGSTKEKPPARETASAGERAVRERATDQLEAEAPPPEADKPSKAAKPKEPVKQAARTRGESAAKAPATSSSHGGEAGQPEVPSQPPNEEKPRVVESSRPEAANPPASGPDAKALRSPPPPQAPAPPKAPPRAPPKAPSRPQAPQEVPATAPEDDVFAALTTTFAAPHLQEKPEANSSDDDLSPGSHMVSAALPCLRLSGSESFACQERLAEQRTTDWAKMDYLEELLQQLWDRKIWESEAVESALGGAMGVVAGLWACWSF
ncbi:Ttn [Symbiodinium sp. CCMP2456]|nr:Ttn [Symbiodinium sp. CCMP2456]